MFLSQSETRGEVGVGKTKGRIGESLEVRGPVFTGLRLLSCQKITVSHFLLVSKVSKIVG